jgi:hypothetical protein
MMFWLVQVRIASLIPCTIYKKPHAKLQYPPYYYIHGVKCAARSTLPFRKVAESTYIMYQVNYMLPESKYTKPNSLKVDNQEAELYNHRP